MSSKRLSPADQLDASTKKCRVDHEDPIFRNFPENMKKQIALHLHELCDIHRGPDLNSLRFYNCNAADVNGGVSFLEAYCSVKPFKTKTLGSVFVNGLAMIARFLEEGEIPESKHERFVLGRLLHYLVEEKQSFLLDVEECDEVDLTIVLVNHLIGKLATTPRYVVDKYGATAKKIGRGTLQCPCPIDCDISGVFGDTSIGNGEVWHGDLDVIVNQDVGITALTTEDNKPDSPGETKLNSSCLEIVNRQQIIAQTVVFSFLQKQIQPLSNHFLVPCFGVTSTGVVIYFYDSEHDVLLESSHIPLFTSVKNEPQMKVNLTAILASWLTVNYKYLSGGLPESLKYDHKKADFFSQAKEKIEIYRNHLRLGDVEMSLRPSVPTDPEDSDDDSPDELGDIRSTLYKVAYGGKKGK